MARAALWRNQKLYSLAIKDLEKVKELAGEMKLYQVDANLLKGNIFLDQAFNQEFNETSDNQYEHEISKCYDWVDKAECCLEYVQENIRNLKYDLRCADQKLLELRLEIVKQKINLKNKEIKVLGEDLTKIIFDEKYKYIHKYEFESVKNEFIELSKSNNSVE